MARRAVRRRKRVRPVCVWRSSDKRTHIQNIPKDISAISRRRVALRRVRKPSKKARARDLEIFEISRARADAHTGLKRLEYEKTRKSAKKRRRFRVVDARRFFDAKKRARGGERRDDATRAATRGSASARGTRAR